MRRLRRATTTERINSATATQRLFAQHNAYWLPPGVPFAGSIQVFNNGQGRPGGNSSSVDVLTPPKTAPALALRLYPNPIATQLPLVAP